MARFRTTGGYLAMRWRARERREFCIRGELPCHMKRLHAAKSMQHAEALAAIVWKLSEDGRNGRGASAEAGVHTEDAERPAADPLTIP